MTNSNGTKEFDLDEAERRSVIQTPPNSGRAVPQSGGSWESTFWFVNGYADEIVPWGTQHKTRDRQLRQFIAKETIFGSALGIICARNAGFSWKVSGPPRSSAAFQDILENANNGKGWDDLIVKTTIDLSTQDNGAAWELVRTEDSAEAPVIGLNHLDIARCWHTGINDYPLIYQDLQSKFHLLADYQCIEFTEMPASIEALGYYGLQYSVLTRILNKVQITRNIDIYDKEKTSGRYNHAVHLVKGVTTQQLKDAIAEANLRNDNAGLQRFAGIPVILGTLDPTADVGVATINLTEMPTEYNPDIAYSQYINNIAMAFATDYQEFAPLPGQRLGTGAQSEILHLKSRGKGPGRFMRMITRAINFRIAPQNVTFIFNEQDMEAEKTDAEVRAIRAQTRSNRIASFEITPEVARQIAVDEGDLEYDYLKLMGEEDVTPDTQFDSEEPATNQDRTIIPGQPGPNGAPLNPNSVPGPARRGPGRVPSANPPTPLGDRLRA